MADDGRFTASLREQVTALTAELAAAHAKLGELHGTDVVALRRLVAALRQHAAALALEVAGLPESLGDVETVAWPPSLLLQEAAVLAGCGVLATGAHRLLTLERGVPLWLRLAPYAFATGFSLYHLASRTEERVTATAARNAHRVKALRSKARLVEERVAINSALLEPVPPLEPPGHVAVRIDAAGV